MRPYIFALIVFLIPIRFLQSTSISSFSFQDLFPSDLFHFGAVWKTIKQRTNEETLLSLIENRRLEIYQLKEHWRTFVEEQKREYFFYENLEDLLRQGTLKRTKEGAGGSYLLLDAKGVPRFIVKPIDEDILCLNNYKYLGSPFNDCSLRVRECIPLYRSTQIAVLAYETAHLMQLDHITPQTKMGIFFSESFYDIAEDFTETELAYLTKNIDKEKLCSVQNFIPNACELFTVWNRWVDKGLSEEAITSLISQSDFEDANIFIWTIYDTDAHAGNFLLFIKSVDEQGKTIYGLEKIDNSLCFPEKNRRLLNALSSLPNAKNPLSSRARSLIQAIPTEKILEKMNLYQMPYCKKAFIDRIEILKELAQREDLSISSINFRMTLLEQMDGKELALSTLPDEELKNTLYPDKTWKISSSVH